MYLFTLSVYVYVYRLYMYLLTLLCVCGTGYACIDSHCLRISERFLPPPNRPVFSNTPRFT